MKKMKTVEHGSNVTTVRGKNGRYTFKWNLPPHEQEKAIKELLELRGKIEFQFTAEELEAREIRGQRKRRKLLMGGR